MKMIIQPFWLLVQIGAPQTQRCVRQRRDGDRQRRQSRDVGAARFSASCYSICVVMVAARARKYIDKQATIARPGREKSFGKTYSEAARRGPPRCQHRNLTKQCMLAVSTSSLLPAAVGPPEMSQIQGTADMISLRTQSVV